MSPALAVSYQSPTSKSATPIEGKTSSFAKTIVLYDAKGKILDEVSPDSQGNFVFTNVKLRKGDNSFSIRVTTKKGKSAKKTFSIVYKPKEDRTPPAPTLSLSYKSPASKSTATIQSKTSPPAKTAILYNSNGKKLDEVSPDSKGNFVFTNVKLRKGKNSFSVKVTTKNGKSTKKSLLIVYKPERPAVKKDRTPPKLLIREPTSNILVNKNRITIKGKTEKGATLTLNGRAKTISSHGTFSFNIKLKVGKNTLRLTSMDKAGNKVTKTILVTYKPLRTPAPEPVKKTLKQQIADKVNEKLGNKSNQDKPRIIKIEDFTGTTGVVRITINADENFTSNMTKEGMWLDDISIFKEIPKLNSKITTIGVSSYFPMSDIYGRVKDEEVMYVELSKETWNKVNWDNFLGDNLKTVADSYYEHPALNK